MRFSIRWLLMLTAYVALVTGAIHTQRPILIDLIWAVPLVGSSYAVVVACVDRGKRQAMAIGFVAMVATHIACMYANSYRLPAVRFYEAAGYAIADGDIIYEGTTDPSTNVTKYTMATGQIPTLRTANGVFTFAAGLAGCLIGSLAYRHRSGA